MSSIGENLQEEISMVYMEKLQILHTFCVIILNLKEKIIFSVRNAENIFIRILIFFNKSQVKNYMNHGTEHEKCLCQHRKDQLRKKKFD